MNFKGLICVAIIVSLYSMLTINRNSLWIDGITLSKDMTSKSPGVARVWNSYGIALMAQERFDEAISVLNISLEKDKWYLESNYNIAVCFIKTGMYNNAIESFEYVLKINDTLRKGHFGISANTGYDLQSLSNLGNLYTVTGKLEKGIINFNRALKIKPDDVSTRFNLAVAYKRAGMLTEAKREFTRVLELNPSDSGARTQLNMLNR